MCLIGMDRSHSYARLDASTKAFCRPGDVEWGKLVRIDVRREH